ncbi:MAG: FtsH protease activity modulator HflK [Alphaproteobacteria bacterium]|jgi:membrane protease subunit HflK|nr:FtsH protease activity modulator HflK [Alphaproteobacteria bacterium]
MTHQNDIFKTTGNPWDIPSSPEPGPEKKSSDFFENLPPVFKNGQNPKSFIMIGVALLLGGWLLSGFYQVNPDEQGIVLRFGKWTETTTEGWRYHLPYPIEQVLKPKITVTNQINIGFGSLDESLMLTGDRNIVDLSFTVQWRIQDPIEYLFNIRDIEKTIKSAAESVMRDTISQVHIDRALAEGRSDIERIVQENLQTLLNDYKAGVMITRVSLKKVDPPQQVIEDFLEVERAQSDQGRIINQAQAYHNEVLPKARGEASEIIAGARGYKEALIAHAEGEAKRFMVLAQEYEKDPKLMKKRLSNETLESIYKGAKKVVVDPKSGILPHMALPAVTQETEQKP